MLIEGLSEKLLEFIDEKTDPLSIIMGQEDPKEKILASLLAGHHLLIEGPPGIGKTTLVKHLASILPKIESIKGCPFHCDPGDPVCPRCRELSEEEKSPEVESVEGRHRLIRIQGSPDLTVEDLLGDIDPSMAFQFGPQDHRAFTPGKLLKGNRGIVFFDELNRVQEKLQNALLQVLEEGFATIGPFDVDFPSNFVMIGTMNPREHAGVEELSDVLLDRFDVIKMGYPETPELEAEILVKFGKDLGVGVPGEVLDMIVKLVRATRDGQWKSELEQGASVRGGLSLFEKIQGYALVRGRKEADVGDVKRMAVSSLLSRIKPSPESRYYDEPEEILQDIIREVMEA